MHSVVEQYWTAKGYSRESLRESGPFGVVLEQNHPNAEHGLSDIGELAATVPVAFAADAIGRSYAALLPRAHRARSGVYFTPPPVVRRVLDLARTAVTDLGAARVLDPAVGAGAFLIPIAEEKVATTSAEAPVDVLHKIASTLHGIEIDGFSAWVAQVMLDVVLGPLAATAGSAVPRLIEVRDAMTVPDREAFDLVVGNPPYGRVSLSPDARRRFSRGLYGHANMYGVFTQLAVDLVNRNGVVALVIPTSFLSGKYFSKLREVLSSDVQPIAIEFLRDRAGVFDDVLQETCIAVFRRGRNPREVRTATIQSTRSWDVRVHDVASFTLPRPGTSPWFVPRAPEHAALLDAARRRGVTLRDLGYRVSTGPLVWNRRRGDLHQAPGPHRFPLVWAEAVRSDGRLDLGALGRTKRGFIELRPLVDDFLLHRDPAVLVQRTTAKEQPRRIVAAELGAAFLEHHGTVVVENHLNVIRAFRPTPVTPTALAAVLRTKIVDDLLRCISGSVAVSAYELEALPMPSQDVFMAVDRALEVGQGPSAVEAIVERHYLEPVAEAA